MHITGGERGGAVGPGWLHRRRCTRNEPKTTHLVRFGVPGQEYCGEEQCLMAGSKPLRAPLAESLSFLKKHSLI